jgi:signal transduction histidine kinase
MTEAALQRLLETERAIAWIRLAAVIFAAVEVGVFNTEYPAGYAAAAWALTGAFAAGTGVLFVVSRRQTDARAPVTSLAALVFDTAVIGAYAVVYSYEYGSPVRWALIFAVVEGAVRYGLVGGVGVAIALVPFFAFVEWWRADRFGPPDFLAARVVYPAGLHLLLGGFVGWLVLRLDTEARLGADRAAEAERLRDELGRRVDVLEAANRCARALASSLELEHAFGAFLRELRGLVPFERTAIVLVEDNEARTMATAGRGADVVFPPGSTDPVSETVMPEVMAGTTVYRHDLEERRFPADERLLSLGLRSEVVSPLVLGGRPIGMISVSRADVEGFTAEETEFLTLLGRLVATAVQNIRAYEAERHRVEELGRLSALRADFVSLVSHELRSPMAAVIGSARTLQERWRQLTPSQREAFLALIADETSRLAELIGDVLDTSRIEAGTFSYAFDDVDVAALVQEAVATVSIGQDEVEIRASISPQLPAVRGDRDRLRQVLTNLIDNALKYSPAGGAIEVSVRGADGYVRVAVTDEGPGIPVEQQRLIFEKFGRAQVPGASKPGTGLGLFIARSIAETHGGTLEVRSQPQAGSTFTLTLPVVGASS